MPTKSYQQTHSPLSKSTHSSSPQNASPSPTQLLQRAEVGAEHLTPHDVLQLQRTLGNRAVAHLMKQQVPTTSVPIQRTVDTAAQALFENKHVKAVTLAHLTAKFQGDHTVLPTDLAAIQAAVLQLRVNNAAKTLRGRGLKDITDKTFKAKEAREFNLALGDLGAVKTAFDLVVASEETEEQRRVRVFLNEDLARDSSAVTLTLHSVIVHLDNDQLKHQKQKHPIGTRGVGGGQKFKIDGATPECGSQAWHLANTLPYMAGWARDIGVMTEGQKNNHGQITNVNGIHYEGFCIFAGGQKYVMFHCYPHAGGAYDGGKKV